MNDTKDGTDLTVNNVRSKDMSLKAKPQSNNGADDLLLLLDEFWLNFLNTRSVRILPTIPKQHKLPVIPTDMMNLYCRLKL